jgi:hypothetical protein
MMVKTTNKAETAETVTDEINTKIRDAIFNDIQGVRQSLIDYTLDKVNSVVGNKLSVAEQFAYLERYIGFTKSLVGLKRRK